MASVQQRIKAGADLLDQHVDDWESKVHLDLLEMRSGDYCILGQVYGGFITGCKRLGITETPVGGKGYELGFTTNTLTSPAFDRKMLILQKAWIALITKRRTTA